MSSSSATPPIGLIVAAWIVSVTLFLVSPCLSSSYQRESWWRRLRQCKWDVDMEPEPEPEVDWMRAGRARFAAQQERERNLSAAEFDQENEICLHFLRESMARFTTVRSDQACDIRSKTDAEKDEARPNINRTLADTLSPGLQSTDSSGMVSADLMYSKDCEDEDTSAIATNEGDTRRDASEMLHDDIEKGITPKSKVQVNIQSLSDGGGECDDDQAIVGEFEECDTIVCIPAPGEPLSAWSKPRYVPNGCAICLSDFIIGDRVTWSAATCDPHIFHEQCMLEYLLAVGAKAARKRRQGLDDQVHQGEFQDAIMVANDFPMMCPCCRKTFVFRPPCSSGSTTV